MQPEINLTCEFRCGSEANPNISIFRIFIILIVSTKIPLVRLSCSIAIMHAKYSATRWKLLQKRRVPEIAIASVSVRYDEYTHVAREVFVRGFFQTKALQLKHWLFSSLKTRVARGSIESLMQSISPRAVSSESE